MLESSGRVSERKENSKELNVGSKKKRKAVESNVGPVKVLRFDDSMVDNDRSLQEPVIVLGSASTPMDKVFNRFHH